MPSRKPTKPAKLPTSTEEARRTNVLLEELKSDFKAFGDGLKAAREKLESTFDQTGRNFEAIGRVENRLKIIEKDVKDIKTQFQTFDHRLAAVEAR